MPKQIRQSERTWPTMRVRGGGIRWDTSQESHEVSPLEPEPVPKRDFGVSIGSQLTQAVERALPPPIDFAWLDRLGREVETAIRRHVPAERWHSDPTKTCPSGREHPERLYVYDFELPGLALGSDTLVWLLANPECWTVDALSKRKKLTLATLRYALLNEVNKAQRTQDAAVLRLHRMLQEASKQDC